MNFSSKTNNLLLPQSQNLLKEEDQFIERSNLVSFKETLIITFIILVVSIYHYVYRRQYGQDSSFSDHPSKMPNVTSFVGTYVHWIRIKMNRVWNGMIAWFGFGKDPNGWETLSTCSSTYTNWKTPLRKVTSSPFIYLSYNYSQHSQDENEDDNSHHENTHHRHHPSMASPSLSKPLTEHERFERHYYNHIQSSSYRRLVLPPKCRQVIFQSSNLKSNAAAALNENITLHTKNILSWFLDIAHGIISFDIIGNFVVVCYRMISAIQIRLWKHFGYKLEEEEDEEEEEEEDDNTVASGSSRKSVMSKGSNSSTTVHATNIIRRDYGTKGMIGENALGGTCVPDSSAADQSNVNVSLVGSMNSRKETNQKLNQTDEEQSSHEMMGITTVTVSQSNEFQTRERFFTSDNDFKYKDQVSPSHYPKTDTSFDLSSHSYDELNLSRAGSWGEGEIDGMNTSVTSVSQEVPFDENDQQEVISSPQGILTAEIPSPLSSSDIEPNLIIPQSPEISTNTLPSNLIIPKLERLTSKTKRSGSLRSKEKDAVKRYRIPIVKPNFFAKVNPTEKNLPSEVETKASGEPLNFFDTASNERSLKRLGSLTPNADKEGYVLGDEHLEDVRDTPLLTFVNSRSGSQQGLILKMQLRSLLNPIQVWDLADGGPEKVLKSFSVFSRLRILVCGGDGTVSWIMSALDKMKLEKWPPIAILPLGTGNDLARVHGWGSGYANESLLQILNQVQESYVSLLDRWTLVVDPKKKKRKELEKIPFTNYMSIGMDALSALQVHNLRENSPHMFFARAVNKVWYAVFGAEDAIKASYTDLHEQIILEADGMEIPIPENSQGLIFLNIDSYLGGVPLWSRGMPVYKTTTPKSSRERRYSDGDNYVDEINKVITSTSQMKSHDDDQVSYDHEVSYEETVEDKLARIIACDKPSSCQDGLIEVVSHSGNFHLGQIRVGLSNAKKLCQCSNVRIKLKKKIAIQIDGEPWMQEKAILTIQREREPAIMLHKALEEGGGIEMEVANLLEWAEEESHITKEAHAALMKEFSKRIEMKNRDRRIKQGTVFSNMKKRISSTPRLRQM